MEREYKDSGIEWIGKIPKEWEVKKLKFIVSSISKGNGITKEEVFKDGNTPCVRYGEIYSKYNIYFKACLSATYINIQKSPQFFCYGDILCAGTGELIDEIGKNIVYLGDKQCLAGGDIIIIHHFQNPRFLNYALNSHYAQIQKSRGKAKLKVVHISASEIGSIFLLLPPLPEQQRIADYLDSKCDEIDKLIELQDEMIKKLNEYKQSVITEAVTKGLNPNAKLVPSGIEWIGEVPEGWKVCRIKDLVYLQSGSNLTTMEITDVGDYPVYGGNGLRGYYNEYSNEGDFILIGRQGALCGNINYASGKFWATEHAAVCYPKRHFAKIWLGELLRAMNLGQYSLSAAQPGLAVERIKNLRLPLPPLPEQRSIAAFLDKKCAEIDFLISLKQQKIERLRDYKKSIIYEAVTGKKEVI